MPEPSRHRHSLIRAALLLLISLPLEWSLTRRFFWPGADGFTRRGCPVGDDFVNGWAAIRLAMTQRIDLLFDLDNYTPAINAMFGRDVTFHLWSYPPTALLLYLPFLHVGFSWSQALWSLAGLAAYMGVARAYLGGGRWLALVMVLLAPAAWHNLFDGQNGFLTAALFVGGCLAMKRRPALAGILFGLLTFKPQLGLILPFALIALRAWRVILFACLTAAAFAALSIAVFGFDAWIDYVTVTIVEQSAQLAEFDGFFTGLMVSLYAGLRAMDLPNGTALAVQAAMAITVIVLACRALRRTGDTRRHTLILASAVPLISPYLYTYDLPLLSIPLAAALFASTPPARWRQAAYACAFISPVLVMVLGFSRYSESQILCPLMLLASFCAAISAPDREAAETMAIPAEATTLA